jgi:hypothetical protein
MPTILDWLDLSVPSHVRGTSYLPLLTTSAVDPGARAILSESLAVPPGIEAPAIALRRGDHKLIRARATDGRIVSHYFDLASDPGERHPRDARRHETGRRLIEELEAILREHDRVRPRLRAEEAPAQSGTIEAQPMDPAREEKLRALGYIE